MIQRFWMLTVLSVLIAGFSQVALAHALKVFAYPEAEQIVGRAYFASGAPLAEGKIFVEQPRGERVDLRTDESGAFALPAQEPGRYRVVADTGEGHRADWWVEISSPPAVSPQAQGVDVEQLSAMIRLAIAQEIGPLRIAVHEYHSEVRFGDVIGGIGFIFGIAGLLVWWRGRRR
jgi:nickel transport protein